MPDRNYENRTLYHGDNLAFLRGMNSGTVNLIATDPPFNKKRDFHATPDSAAAGARFLDRWSWRDDLLDEWLTDVQENAPEVWEVIMTAKTVYGDDMGAYLCWLGVRLLEMHRALADDGSLYLHIDHTAHAWVKCLMDAIFGQRGFRNEIVWAYTGPGSPKMRQFSRKHDTLLWYSKGGEWTFNADAVRVQHKRLNTNRKGRVISDAMTAELRDSYLKRGKVPESWWSEFSPVGRLAKERLGYPTQKPLALYERIIRASSNEGDLVLDPFCGCATTLVAAERLGRQWVGVDIWDNARQIVLDRLELEGLAVRERSPKNGAQTLTFADVHFETAPPDRTDGGATAALYLWTPTGAATRYPRPRTQHGRLLADLGACCQGCGADYAFDPRVLEVDHINPKSSEGTDAYENLTLLCPPCNKEKRDRLTLVGLQQENRRNGHMKNEGNLRMGRAAGQKGRARRRG